MMWDINHISEKHFKKIFIAYIKSGLIENEHYDLFRIAFSSQAKTFSTQYIIDGLLLLTK